MTENPFKISLGVDTPEENTDRMVKEKTLSLGAIEVYADLYHKLMEAVMNADDDLADKLREEIKSLNPTEK